MRKYPYPTLTWFLVVIFSFRCSFGHDVAPCGNGLASTYDVILQSRLVTKFRNRQVDSLEQPLSPTVIPVCFYSFRGLRGRGDVSLDTMQAQLDQLNDGFSDRSCCNATLPWCEEGTCSLETGFRFEFAVKKGLRRVEDGKTVPNATDDQACVERLFNPFFARSGRVRHILMKLRHRRGDKRVLNVYFVRLVTDNLGYSSFPWSNGLSQDGIVLHVDAPPGGDRKDTKEGDVLVHEVGHWMGLLHTFQGGCRRSDGVVDTPPEAMPFMGCNETQVNRDSCAGDGLPDPVFNFMDYADDACKFEFTAGQIFIMRAAWDFYRLGNRDDPAVISLVDGEESEPIDILRGVEQVFQFRTSSNSACSFRVGEGRVHFAARWNRPPLFRRLLDRCTVRRRRAGSCEIRSRRRSRVLYAAAKSANPVKAAQGVIVSCYETLEEERLLT